MGGIRDAKHPNQASLWESKIKLGERFFHEIITNSLPINMKILRRTGRCSRRRPSRPGSPCILPRPRKNTWSSRLCD